MPDITPTQPQLNDWRASDAGYIAWAYDPSMASTNTTLASDGVVYTVRLKLRNAALITNVVMIVTGAGVGLTANQCLAGIYNGVGGTLLGTTADQSTAWLTQGEKTMAIAGGPVVAPAGDLVVAFFTNGGTKPGFSRVTNTASQINAGLSAANSRFGTADTGRTTSLPATLGTISALGVNYWCAVS